MEKHTEGTRAEVSSALSKLATLRDEVKLRMHLASLDAKKEWEDKIAPHLFEIETAAKGMGEHSKDRVLGVIAKVEDFLHRLQKTDTKN